MKYALGIIETVGLAAGIQAADTAVKSANVRLIGYELTKGDGMATVKIEGDVGAVNAAIHAAKASASLVNKVYGFRVIPRPSDSLEMLVRNKETVGYTESSPPQVESIANAEPPVVETDHTAEEAEEEEATDEEDVALEAEAVDEAQEEPVDESVKVEVIDTIIASDAEEAKADSDDNIDIDEVCNICHDPACTRKKGELRRFCIHYYDDK